MRGSSTPVVWAPVACGCGLLASVPVFLLPSLTISFSEAWNCFLSNLHSPFLYTHPYLQDICSSHSVFLSIVLLGAHSGTTNLKWLPGLSQVQGINPLLPQQPGHTLRTHFCGLCTCCSFCLVPFHISYAWIFLIILQDPA